MDAFPPGNEGGVPRPRILPVNVPVLAPVPEESPRPKRLGGTPVLVKVPGIDILGGGPVPEKAPPPDRLGGAGGPALVIVKEPAPNRLGGAGSLACP